MTYFERNKLRAAGGQYEFRMDCPYCTAGTLLINIDPELLRHAETEDFYGIRVHQCEPECTCPLPDQTIRRIEQECKRRAGV